MQTENLLEIIKKRRSIREFKKKKVAGPIIEKALEAARWAPSGLNNQPWKFKVLEGEERESLAQYTKYNKVIECADKLILVFLDKESSYNHKKDLMAVGAAIQNILLYLHSQGIGTCWLGEILNKAKEVEAKLKTGPQLELAAVIALGIPQKQPSPKKRKSLTEIIL